MLGVTVKDALVRLDDATVRFAVPLDVPGVVIIVEGHEHHVAHCKGRTNG